MMTKTEKVFSFFIILGLGVVFVFYLKALEMGADTAGLERGFLLGLILAVLTTQGRILRKMK